MKTQVFDRYKTLIVTRLRSLQDFDSYTTSIAPGACSRSLLDFDRYKTSIVTRLRSLQDFDRNKNSIVTRLRSLQEFGRNKIWAVTRLIVVPINC